MRRVVSGDAGAQLLLIEARRRLEAARGGHSHRVGISDDGVGQLRTLAGRGPAIGLGGLVRRLRSALSRPRRICVE